MKTSIQKRAGLALLVSIAVVLSLIFNSSCSQKMTFRKSEVVPGAQGTIKIRNDKNNNYHINLDVVNLASPEMLTPSKKEYVVWLINGDEVRKIGRLNSSRSAMSQTLKGSLETLSTIEPQGFMITAEDNTDVTTPGKVVVLRTR
jgi:hypothetical protein